MTSTVIVVASGLLLFGWVVNLIRKGSVYVEYGSALLIAIGGIICIALIPAQFLEALMHRAGNIMPGGFALFLAIYCILLTLSYLLKEITAISMRLRTLTQQLAIELARHGSTTDSGEPVSEAKRRSEGVARISRSRSV